MNGLYAYDCTGALLTVGAALTDAAGRTVVYLDPVKADPGGVIRVGPWGGSLSEEVPAATLAVRVTSGPSGR